MSLQVLGPLPILLALAVMFVAFSMHLHHVHKLSIQTLLKHDSSAASTDCNQSDGLLSSSLFLYSGLFSEYNNQKN